MNTVPFRHVLFPTDLSEDNEAAWVHAVKIALLARGNLTTVHVLRSGEWIDWSELPTVREILWRWGVLQPEATREDFARLGIHVQLHAVRDVGAVRGVLDELAENDADLLVMQSHHRDAVDRWLKPSVSEPIARKARVPSLLLPANARPLVSAADGSVKLQRVLLPVGMGVDQQPAVDAAVKLARALGVSHCHGTLLHAGTRENLPELDLRQEGWTWDVEVASAPVLSSIREAAARIRPDAIVMATRGHDEALDVLLGSTTERVLHAVDCPVLAVPVH